jgi:hypothetical protein
VDTVVWILVAIAIIAVLAIGLFAWTMSRKHRSERLREGFGPEYDREVQRMGRGKAESELEQRKKRVEQLNITPLSSQQAVGYQRDWDGVQSHFVDDPSSAISDADDLVGQVMQARGYPMGDFDQRIADISVDHAEVASNYRMAHAIAGRNRQGEATTEELRQAMVHYRSLFQNLLEVRAEAPSDAERRQPKPA